MKLTVELPCVYSEEMLLQDFEAAKEYDKVRVGEYGLYFTKLSGASCLPYSAVTRAELRQEEFSANCCCGVARVDLFVLLAKGEDGDGG